MAVQAMGPTYAGGTEPVVSGGYSVLVTPDINNRELQAAGERPVFYWIPNQVRMARKNGPDDGDYLFNLVRFAGTGGEGTIGGGGGDVAGGVLTFSVTGALPEAVHRQVLETITSRFRGSTDAIWGIAPGVVTPDLRPAMITSSTTTVSTVAPTTRGLPTLVTNPRTGRELQPFGMPAQREGARAVPTTPVRDGAGASGGGNLNPWYWEMQGNGSGSVDPSGTHAFSGMLGVYPASICWEAFHGTASPLIVIQTYQMKVWSPVCKLTIDGEWSKIKTSFEAHLSGRYMFASVDLKAAFSSMRADGTITVDLKVDTTIPGAAEIAKRLDERSDLVFNKFMEQAKGLIFDPVMPDAQAAPASSGTPGLSPWGVGLTMSYRRDSANLKLHFEQTEQFAYLQEQTVSSSLAGMYDEIKKDPLAEKKYFLTVNLDDWPRRLARVCRPVVRWDDGAVDFVDVSIGALAPRNVINWDGHSFGGGDGADGTWKYQTVQRSPDEITDPPEGWAPDKTFVKRRVHLKEPASALVDPYSRIQIERNVIDLDPGPNGTLLNDTTLEIRADNAGGLAVGPIELGVVLTDATQVVEAVFEPVDPDTGDSLGMEQVRFRWSNTDLNHDRKWLVYTGDPQFRPFYRYQVIVTVKGTLFEAGRSWAGPWVQASGNGPLLVNVPRPDAAGVTPRTAPKDAIQLTRELPATLPVRSGEETEDVVVPGPREGVPVPANGRPVLATGGAHRDYPPYRI